MPRRHHSLDEPDYEVDRRPLRETKHVAELRDDDVLDSGPGDDLSESRGEVRQDDNCLGAGILQLMFQLAGGIERIAVHHRVAGAQRAEQRNRVL
jgi:hypothetical protein